MRAQYKINFDRPPRLKKLPEALIISPELRHLYIQTDRHKFTNRNLDRLYITRPKRMDTSKRRHAILHVKNSVLPSAAIRYLFGMTIREFDRSGKTKENMGELQFDTDETNGRQHAHRLCAQSTSPKTVLSTVLLQFLGTRPTDWKGIILEFVSFVGHKSNFEECGK